MNHVHHIGIKHANIFVRRGFYATACSTWYIAWQVSGHLHPEAKQSSWSSSPHSTCRTKDYQAPVFRHSRSQTGTRKLRRLKWVTVNLPGIRLAGMFPGYAPKRTGRRRIWRHSCNARAWTPVATCSPALTCALPGSISSSCWVCTGCSVFPSSVFSQNTFKTWMRNLPKASSRTCQAPHPPRNHGANAKS